MKKRIILIAAVLALCLCLLPGSALAVDETTGVTFANGGTEVPLTDGKFYVAATDNKGITQQDAAPESGAYLAYSGGTLTVHGAFETNATIYVNSNLTITGGADSSLNVTGANGAAFQLSNDSTLTLDGSVDFTANTSGSPVIFSLSSTGTFGTTEDYSGDIALGCAVNIPVVSDTTLNVQNSASIAITGMIQSGGSVVLKSTGDVSIISGGPINASSLTVKGNDVSISHNNNTPVYQGKSLNITATGNVTIQNGGQDGSPTIIGTAEISAGGDVTISGGSLPIVPSGSTAGLTISGAQNVSISGSSGSNPFFYVPVTFTDCNSVTVTDNGDGDILKEGVTVTSDKPWTAKTGDKTVTMPSGNWTYGGDITNTFDRSTGNYKINSAVPIVYKAGEGKIFYEPAAAEGGTAVLTLDGASFAGGTVFIPVSSLPDSIKPLRLELKGDNRIEEIQAMAHLTLTGTGSFTGELLTGGFANNSTGTLNAVVGVTLESDSRYGYTVYGECSTSGSGFNVSKRVPLTIAEGATLTVDAGDEFIIGDFVGLTNNGTIINNSTIKMYMEEDTEDAAISAFIKGLKLTGTGTVEVKKGNDPDTPKDTYTNSGTKLLDPVGTLDLSTEATNTDYTDGWESMGYKWTDVVKGENGNVTSATLTLAEGFNANEVVLPDATVTIVTTGESRIGKLTPPADGYGNTTADNMKLTFSGTGKLSITKHIEITNGDNNSITVAEDAEVEVNGGISIGASGAVNGLVTVNGKLTIAQGDGVAAINTGKVQIGSSGHLKVTGVNGIKVNGNPSEAPNTFKDAFVIEQGGIFDAECSEYNIKVSEESNAGFPEDIDLKMIIRLPESYLSDGYTLGKADGIPDVDGRISNHAISITNDPSGLRFDERGKLLGAVSGKFLLHENHNWSSAWTDGGGDTHYHACTFEGCTAKNDESPHYYAHGSTACRDCGHARPADAPDSDGGGGSSGSSSSGGGDSSYIVKVEEASHGEVSSNHRTASAGDTVTLTVTADSGYTLDTLTVTDSRGGEIKLTEKDGGRYTFTMPSRDVTVKAVFVSSACTGGADCPSRGYSDLNTDMWYHEAVDYVLRNELMSGYGGGLFGPDDTLSRAQFAQIIYNGEGRPSVTGGGAFTDVSPDAWYAPAVNWAAAKGIVSGYGDGLFGPDDKITREQLAAMLWRYAGSPETGRDAEFDDMAEVSAYALEAVDWARANGIVQGRDGNRFDPKGSATRAEAAAMLMRFLSR